VLCESILKCGQQQNVDRGVRVKSLRELGSEGRVG